MKRKIILMIAMAIVNFSLIKAQDYKTAVGIRLSSNDAAINNSITVKHFFNTSIAIEGLLSFGDPIAIGALVQQHNIINGVTGLKWLYGAGAYVGFGNNRNLGAQGILGLDYKFQSIPLNISLDWKPELNFVKDFSFEPAAIGASVRFTFN